MYFGIGLIVFPPNGVYRKRGSGRCGKTPRIEDSGPTSLIPVESVHCVCLPE